MRKRIQWDSVHLEASNAPEAEPLIRKTYRDDFSLKV
jgi:hypothetical protein